MRTVALDPPAYRAAWARLQARAGELGCRAWLFRAVEDPDRYVEFLEWKDAETGTRPLNDRLIVELLASLEDFGPGSTDHLIEP